MFALFTIFAYVISHERFECKKQVETDTEWN